VSRIKLALALLLPMLLVAACGSSGVTKTAGAASGTVGFVTGDAPVDGLSSVSLTVTSVILKRANGTFTANLLPTPRAFNFLGLARSQAILSQADLPAGTYREVSITIDPNSVEARDKSGAVVPVSVASGTDSDGFSGSGSSALKVVGGKFKTVAIDLDLANSLQDDPGVPGGLILDLRIRGRQETADIELESFRGEVVSVNRATSSFVLKVKDDDAPDDSFGRAVVKVEDGDFLADAQGVAVATADAFLAALSPGTGVEGKGAMSPDGKIDASRLKIEDDAAFPVKLKGRIATLDVAGMRMTFLLKRIDKGRDIVEPVLGALGDPGILTIDFNANTPVVGEDGNGAPLDRNDLAPGLELTVLFSAFQGAGPFPAAGFEVDSLGVEFEGTITDISGLPDFFEITLDPDDPAVVNGSVTAPLTVNLIGAQNPSVFLDVEGSPAVLPDDLLLGLQVKAEGKLSGNPATAQVIPTRVEIDPGALEGTVSAVQSGAVTLTVDVDQEKDPFGGNALGPVATLQAGMATLIEGKDGPVTFADIETMFNNLQAGEALNIRARGIALPSGDVRAYEIQVEVK